MTGRTEVFHDTTVFVRENGPLLAAERDAVDLMSEASAAPVDWIAVPADQFAPEFFQLKTRLAGLFIQKLVNYGQRLAIVGDMSKHMAASDALRDFVTESNRGRHVWFVADMAELEQRLGRG